GDALNVHVGLNGGGQSLANRRSMIPARVVWVNRAPTAAGRPTVEIGVEFLNRLAAHVTAA
ncbi:MAG: hypothetical protein JWO31_1502, partial [Phycisphaerales bacterium]|nr:hypothetical protein [Phycisphaerales bacterium]